MLIWDFKYFYSNKMYDLLEPLIVILIIVPILFYVGYSLYFKEETNKTIVYLVLALSVIIVIDHSIKIFKIVNGFGTHQKFNRNVGIFFIALGILLLCFSIYTLILTEKSNNKPTNK